MSNCNFSDFLLGDNFNAGSLPVSGTDFDFFSDLPSLEVLGDTVGTASSLVNLLKTGLSTGADILGGGDAKGGAGFATKPNPARQAALEAQMSQVYGRTASQITSPRGTGARNPHSDAIMRGFNPNAMTSFGRIITASRAGESATRVYGRARETIA